MLSLLDRALKRGGGTHTLADVGEALQRGDMQALWNDDACLITTIQQGPRARYLLVFAAAGTLDGLARLEAPLRQLARDAGCDTCRALARPGLEAPLRAGGWKKTHIAMELAI